MDLEESKDSRQAIGAISDLLANKLHTNTDGTEVKVGRPGLLASSSNDLKLNLFLYQLDIDGQLRNHPLDEGQIPPIWLTLRYLLTAFDGEGESSSITAHRLLGVGMLALQELNFIVPPVSELASNSEPLKITFDSADSELLSKIVQGTDEKYRVSVAFQVRPVMIIPTVPPGYALPVKYVGAPGDEGVLVLPTLGPKLEAIRPNKFVVGDKITLTGLDIGTGIEEIRLGDTAFPVVAVKPGEIKALISIDTTLSAGSYPVRAVRHLPGDKQFSSNALLGHLLPTFEDLSVNLTNDGGNVSGDLTITGKRLGSIDDSIFVAFYRNGEVALMLEPEGSAAQTMLTVEVKEGDALPEGDYYIILRVNGEQATNAPKVNWS